MSESGWYPDPHGRHEQRYWDGAQWTEHVASEGVRSADPPGAVSPIRGASVAAAGWHPDPAGRHEQRYWDGTRWTEHVHSRGRQAVDPFMTHAPSTPSKRVARQVRNADVEADKPSGGTIFTEQVLVVNQKAKVLGSRTEYAVFDRTGRQLGVIRESRRDLSTRLSDSFRGRTEATREHKYQVLDTNDRLLLAVTRPKMGFLQMKGKLVVDGPQGTPVGHIALESFGLAGVATSAAHAIGVLAGKSSAVDGLNKVGHARFGLEAGGQRVGSVHAEDFRKWDFRIRDHGGVDVGRITKTWAGWAKERFTNADNYVVEMHRALEEPLRTLVVAAALAIDVEMKQFGAQTGGSSFLGTRRYS